MDKLQGVKSFNNYQLVESHKVPVSANYGGGVVVTSDLIIDRFRDRTEARLNNLSWIIKNGVITGNHLYRGFVLETVESL